MTAQPVIPEGSPPPLAPYSAGTLADGVLYVSGTLAIDSDGQTVGIGDAAAQTKHVLDAIASVIKTAGGTLQDVTFNQIFLKDLSDYAAMNAAYKEYFPTNPPARYCIRADLVKEDFLVEIATIAHIGK